MKWKDWAILVAPPAVVQMASRLRRWHSKRLVEWEYLPDGWTAARGDPKIKGWSDASVLDVYRRNWDAFLDQLEGPEPLGVSPESVIHNRYDPVLHNIVLTFGYVLALAARQQDKPKVLDWGGSMGHFYLLARKLLLEMELEYHVKDLPLLAEEGRRRLPDVRFHTDDVCLQERYDLVFSSSCLQYFPQWRETLAALGGAVRGYLYVTCLPMVTEAPSFTFVQRPYKYGYQTEYVGWCFNRGEFLAAAEDCRLTLLREFVVGHRPVIHNAPEQNEYRGYLFRSR